MAEQSSQTDKLTELKSKRIIRASRYSDLKKEFHQIMEKMKTKNHHHIEKVEEKSHNKLPSLE